MVPLNSSNRRTFVWYDDGFNNTKVIMGDKVTGTGGNGPNGDDTGLTIEIVDTTTRGGTGSELLHYVGTDTAVFLLFTIPKGD